MITQAITKEDEGFYNYILDLEEQWRKSAPRFTYKELLTIFPEAKPILKEKLRKYSEEANILAEEIKGDLEKLYKQIRDEFSLWFWEKYLEIFKGEPLERLSRKIREIKFALNAPEANKRKITDEMTEKAKQYPIVNLIENKRGFAICPFHPDKKPSLFLRNNYAYCFACGYTADPIKLYMDLTGTDFKTAVKYLSTS